MRLNHLRAESWCPGGCKVVVRDLSGYQTYGRTSVEMPSAQIPSPGRVNYAGCSESGPSEARKECQHRDFS